MPRMSRTCRGARPTPTTPHGSPTSWPNLLAHGLIRGSFVPDAQTQEQRADVERAAGDRETPERELSLRRVHHRRALRARRGERRQKERDGGETEQENLHAHKFRL